MRWLLLEIHTPTEDEEVAQVVCAALCGCVIEYREVRGGRETQRSVW